jgi:hypothetical protein
MKKVQKHIISYESHNEHLCKLRVKGKYNNITLINAYAPTKDKTEETKEQFYNDLQSIVDKVPKSDITIILGDVNAKLGKEPAYNKITGKHTLHEETNRNGELLCDFAAANNMIVMSTQFQHKQIHNRTWISPDQNTINQIDHFLININRKDVIEDVRSLRDPNIDSDRFVLKATLKQKLPKIHKRKSAQTTKWNKMNMQNPSKLRQYRTSLHNKLKAIPDTTNVEEGWERMKEAITEAANEVIQTQNGTTRNEWWDEECRQCIKRKNEARNKWLQQKTRASQESYIKRRKEANVLFRQKKKAWINNKILQIEQNQKRNEIRKFSQEIKTFKPQQIILPTTCKDSRGNMISQIDDVLARWKVYFQNILSVTTVPERLNLTSERTDSHDEVEPPICNEICSIINKLKTSKAAGTDNIPGELMKYGGRTLKQKIYKLILNIWNNETLPAQGNEGIICPIYKKGDRLDGNNYRPITLLNTIYKIFAILLNKRLTDIIENKLDDFQMGFRPNRSTNDNIFIVRQIFEKCYEYNIDLHNIFVDYTQAFDSVSRNKIIECLTKYEIPTKTIRLIGLTLINTTAKVKINNQLTEEFRVDSGVKQGDPLSATLFSIVTDSVLKQLDLRGNISTRLKQCSAYTDDILITTKTKHSLVDTFQRLKEISAQFGLIINEQKTKYLRCTKKHYEMDAININTHSEQVKSFKYLRSTVNENNSTEEEMKERITLGNKAYYANQDLFKSKLLSKKSNLRM